MWLPKTRIKFCFEGDGLQACVATDKRNLRREKRVEIIFRQPRSGDICFSRGREPAGKVGETQSRGAAVQGCDTVC